MMNFSLFQLVNVYIIFYIEFRRWEPKVVNKMPKKEFKHRALDDIRESIQELQFYKNNLMLRNNLN